MRRVWIPKPGSKKGRPLGVPTVRDRVVQRAVLNVIELIFEREFSDHSYGFRPGRGCAAALERVMELLEAGHTHVVDADIRSYFDTIDHDILMARVQQRIADGRVIELLRLFLQQEVMDSMSSWTPEEGTPQGAVIRWFATLTTS